MECKKDEFKVDGTYLSPNNYRHDNFTTTLRVTGNVAGELKDVRHDDSFLARGRGPADAFPEADLLAGGLAVERA